MPLLTGPQKFLQKNHGFPGVRIRYNAVKVNLLHPHRILPFSEYIWENKQKGDVGRVAFGGPICVLYLKSLGIEVQHNQKAGYSYDDETFEKVFKRIYAVFGSAAPYSAFKDSQPFLRWARGKGLLVGIVSNAEYRYQDVILPALGINQGSEWDFGVFSGIEGVEKPNPKIYEIALQKAGNIHPSEALHIGDSMRKDYIPARSVGMHALLLDRFKSPDAASWSEAGAPVVPDLVAAQDWIMGQEEKESPIREAS